MQGRRGGRSMTSDVGLSTKQGDEVGPSFKFQDASPTMQMSSYMDLLTIPEVSVDEF